MKCSQIPLTFYQCFRSLQGKQSTEELHNESLEAWRISDVLIQHMGLRAEGDQTFAMATLPCHVLQDIVNNA